MAVVDSMPVLPFERSEPFRLAPTFLALQDEQPLVRVRTPAGDPAWLVLGYDNVRALLANPNLGRTHADPDRAPRFSDAAILDRPRDGVDTERADHSRMRMVMNRSFSLRRMEALRPRVEAIVAELLDGLEGRTPPADLHEALAFPLPVLVICELLGVPYEDRGRFRGWSDAIVDMSDRGRSFEALGQLRSYMEGLVALKREQPGEDVISDLVRATDVEGRMSEEEAVEMGAGLLFAGHETTVARIDLGVLLLLTHPDQWAALRSDPALVPGAVEEILRCSATTVGVMPRYALADIPFAGEVLRAGEMVLLGLDAANHDVRTFPEPDRFDVTRQRNAHVAFGYGYRFCLGAPLARVELQAVFGALPRRFPDLALAAPPEQLRQKSHMLTGGLEELPVTW